MPGSRRSGERFDVDHHIGLLVRRVVARCVGLGESGVGPERESVGGGGVDPVVVADENPEPERYFATSIGSSPTTTDARMSSSRITSSRSSSTMSDPSGRKADATSPTRMVISSSAQPPPRHTSAGSLPSLASAMAQLVMLAYETGLVTPGTPWMVGPLPLGDESLSASGDLVSSLCPRRRITDHAGQSCWTSWHPVGE